MSRNQKSFKILLERLQKLQIEGYNLEFILLLSGILEAEITDLIGNCDELIKFTTKNSLSLKYRPPSLRNSEKTLGKLINHLNEYIDDREIIDTLKEFNKYRIKIAHKLLDPNVDINKLEVEVGIHVKSFKYINLGTAITHLNGNIIKEIIVEAKK